MPSRTMTPIAPAGVEALGQDEPEGDDAVDAEAGGERDRDVRDDAHRDRQDAGDERRAGATPGRTRCASATRRPNMFARMLGFTKQDVGHDHERGQAGLGLRGEVRAPFGELEVARRSRRPPPLEAALGASSRHRDPSLLALAARRTPGAGSDRAAVSPAVPPRSRLPPPPVRGSAGLRIRYSSSWASRPSSSIWT